MSHNLGHQYGMSYELVFGLSAFAFVSSITPGPNNLMLMASGANFGVRRSVPHMIGVAAGFGFMLVVVGLGLANVFVRVPMAQTLLSVAATLYMLYLAYRIATAAPMRAGQGAGRPMTLLQAAAFQWVNPKAWAMALSAMAIYAPDASVWACLWVTAVFSVINLPCIALWTGLGTQVARVLRSLAALRSFNVGLALLLVASLYPVLMS